MSMSQREILEASDSLRQWFDRGGTDPKTGKKRPPSKHSDLYTDEDPKGTIKGLGFKDKKTAAESIKIIKNSKRKHAHKVQAMLVMIQRAKVAVKRTKDPEKKKNIREAIKLYEPAFEKLKDKKL